MEDENSSLRSQVERLKSAIHHHNCDVQRMREMRNSEMQKHIKAAEEVERLTAEVAKKERQLDRSERGRKLRQGEIDKLRKMLAEKDEWLQLAWKTGESIETCNNALADKANKQAAELARLRTENAALRELVVDGYYEEFGDVQSEGAKKEVDRFWRKSRTKQRLDDINKTGR